MPTRNVSLPQALDQFVDSSIQSGRYDNASEVVRAGLRLLEQEEKKNQEKFIWLKAAIAEGIASLDSSKDSDESLREVEEHMASLTAREYVA